MQLIWDGKPDSGARGAELVAGLQSNQPPEGVSVSLKESRVFVEIPIRSYWAIATSLVSAIMIWFGFESNWFLLVLAPFMIGAAIMQSFGRVSILIQDERARVFEGLAGLGRRMRIPLRAIQRIEYAVKRGKGGSTTWIVVNDQKFGRHLNEQQKRFVIALLLDACNHLKPPAE